MGSKHLFAEPRDRNVVNSVWDGTSEGAAPSAKLLNCLLRRCRFGPRPGTRAGLDPKTQGFVEGRQLLGTLDPDAVNPDRTRGEAELPVELPAPVPDRRHLPSRPRLEEEDRPVPRRDSEQLAGSLLPLRDKGEEMRGEGQVYGGVLQR